MGTRDECNCRSAWTRHARHTHHDRFHLPFDVGILARDVRPRKESGFFGDKGGELKEGEGDGTLHIMTIEDGFHGAVLLRLECVV
jgi:hypothetical protein